MRDHPLLFTVRAIREKETHLALGPLECWFLRNTHDWRVAVRRSPEEHSRWLRNSQLPPADVMDTLSWRRFAAEQGARHLRLSVHFPNRPVVIRPDAPYLIAPGDKVQFFVSVPLSLRVSTDDPDAHALVEEPTVNLSNTWFGSTVDGELCYASRTRAKRSPEELDERRFRIICPVRMRNASREVLTFERVCLRVQFLRVYAGESHFWSNEVGITYRGKDEISRVAYHPRGPSFEGRAQLISEAAESDHAQFKFRSFYSGVMNL